VSYSSIAIIISWLLNAGASVSTRKEDGKSVLRFAAVMGNLDALEMLMQAGGNVMTEDGLH
jgi:ankyrin repeat protein